MCPTKCVIRTGSFISASLQSSCPSADALIEKLGIQLRQGWTPWESNKNIRGTKLFDEVLDKYLSNVEISSRRSTLDNYTSRVNVLREYIKGLAQPIKYAFQFDRIFVTDFLDWVVEKRGSSPRTCNNYRAWCYLLAEFMIERQYITEPTWPSIQSIPHTPKFHSHCRMSCILNAGYGETAYPVSVLTFYCKPNKWGKRSNHIKRED